MNFTSNEFLLFFAVVFGIYYSPPARNHQVWVLIAASLFFYAVEAPILLLLLFFSVFISTVSSYAVLYGDSARRAWFAAAGVALNLALLAFFKYKFLFYAPPPDMHRAADLVDTLLLLPLPIGISFYTFHGISLLVDCLRRQDAFFTEHKAKLGTHLYETVLYLTFFPQLIAGPIVKAKDFYPQIASKRFGAIHWAYALNCLIVGYFLKMVVADNLQDLTFWISAPYYLTQGSLTLVVMLVGYSAQIFADFAGYSLIALGLASLLGYRLPENFNFPYISQSVSEFWRRWHISLSSWLRDYLYIPLGGNRRGQVRTYFNLIAVMFLGGLWHGAAWSFAVWGLWHGVGLAIERPFLNTRYFTSRNAALTAVRVMVIFIFVSFGWLLFKLTNFPDAVGYVKAIYANRKLADKYSMLALIALYSLPVLVYHLLHVFPLKAGQRLLPLAQAAMVFLIITNAGASAPFVYFQF